MKECNHIWRCIGNKRQAAWVCSYCQALRASEPPDRDCKTTLKTVKEIVDGDYCPLPLEVIPNYMGINLVSVGGISWQEQEDGQLVSLIIHFNPTQEKEKHEQPNQDPCGND